VEAGSLEVVLQGLVDLGVTVNGGGDGRNSTREIMTLMEYRNTLSAGRGSGAVGPPGGGEQGWIWSPGQ